MKHLRCLQDKCTPTAKWRWALLISGCFLTGLILTLAIWLVDTQNVGLMFGDMALPQFWYTVALLFGVHAFLSLLSRSLFAGGLITALPALILPLINHYKTAITSTPLQISDFSLVDRLGSIVQLNSGSIKVSVYTIIVIAAVVIWLAVLGFFSRPLRLNWKRSAPFSLIPALALFLVFWVGAEALVYRPLDLPLSEGTVQQGETNNYCGVLLGLWRSKICDIRQRRDMALSQERLDELTQAETELPVEEPDPDREKPNIILILSESFFDVTTLPGVTYETDPLAEFRALQAEGVSGTFYSRTVGYGTSNIELELLTGVNTSLLSGENLYSMEPDMLTRLPTVPALLKQAGYETTMFHLFNDSIYSRTPVFEAIGFDHLYFSGDFAAIDPDAAAAGEEYWSYMEEQIRGEFYSDDYMTDLFIDLYEGHEGNSPLFLYGISMENHTPHNGVKYSEDGYTVTFTSPLSGEAAGALADVSQGVANASQALARLVDYFREQEEPTVILFYGDHRPGMGLSDNVSSVYSALGMVPGLDQSQWTPERLAELHSTSYLIWSNDPDYLPAPAGTVQDTSSNYFGLELLNAADVSLPLYWRLLEQLSDTRVIDTGEYHLGRDGVPSSRNNASAEDRDRMELLALVLHDALYGSQDTAQSTEG